VGYRPDFPRLPVETPALPRRLNGFTSRPRAEDAGTVIYDCVVVGAGAAGITTSRALAEAGVEHLVLERGDIGNTWSTQRWDSFRLNTPGSMNALLGDVGPAEYSTRDETVAILAQRAEGLPVRTRTTVTAARRVGDNLRLTTPEEELEARTLVVASGPKNVALVPAMAANLAPHICTLNADDYRSPEALPDGAVLVVGGGQSGGQIAEDLMESGRDVWWSTSRIGRYRAHYRGRALLDWHVAAGWWATPPDALTDPAAMRTATPLIASNGRDLGIPKLGRMGVKLLGRLAEIDGTRLGFAGDVREFVAFGDRVAAELEKIADDYIAAAGIDAPEPDPDDGRGPVEAPPRPALDVDRDGITTVVWCTGFGGDYRWLPEVDTDAYGVPVLDRSGAAVGDPAIRFVGMPWQSTRASAILHGMPLDARRAVDGVTARLSG
jgi:putative flavoprotein involved in K+ transport